MFEGRDEEMTDDSYRQRLIDAGAVSDIIKSFSGHDLDCVGNILDVYRTSMKQQNPARFEILEFRRNYYAR